MAIACLCANSSAVAQETPRPTTASTSGIPWSLEPRLQIVPSGPFLAQLYGSCTGEVAPIIGDHRRRRRGQGIKPLDAAADLDKQIDRHRKYVEENHGKLVLLERVRTLKNPAPNGSSDTAQPFEIIQRLHVELPVSAPVDAILQRLLELGLDRFGETVLADQ